MSLLAVAIILGSAAGGGFALSLLFTAIARRVAPRFGYVDHPGGHKSHVAPTPYGGGVAMFFAAWLPAAAGLAVVSFADPEWIKATFGEAVGVYVAGLGLRMGPAWVILGGGLVLHGMGLLDDFRPLGALPKLLVIAAVAAMVATLGDVRIADFAGRPIAIAVTIVWLGVIINAMNFLDNMDGLSAGIGCICAAVFVACGLLAPVPQVLVPAMASLFCGAMLGFLVFNFPPAKIFMGDAGSLLIGYMLGVISIMTTYYRSGQGGGDATDAAAAGAAASGAGGGSPYALAIPLVVLAVPLYDFVSVMVIRISEGRNPMRGDQRHFSHRLVERGLSRRAAVLTIYLATATTGLAATLLPSASLRETITIGVLVVAVLWIVAILESPLRRKPGTL